MAEVVLALDVGEARIGLARGELGSSFVFGRGYLRRGSPADDIAALKELARTEGAETLVVGLPRRTDGGESRQTESVREFVRQLREAGFTVELEDERYTTLLAGNRIRESGANRRTRREKGRLDEESAVLILESYLARRGGASE